MPKFEAYLDARDLTACFQADEVMGCVNERLSENKLFFPLWLDENASLRSNLCSRLLAPRCLRYGSFSNNVLGMNWLLPNGDEVGVGGRVIKNVTGLNLGGFLLTTDKIFGSPTAFVLRLRPASYPEHWRKADFDITEIEKFRRLLACSPFYHAFDAFTAIIKPLEQVCYLAFRAPFERTPVFDRFLNAEANWLSTKAPEDFGCHASVMLKTLPSRSLEMARRLSAIMNAPVVCYPLHGFICVREENRTFGQKELHEIEKLGAQCLAEGGSYETCFSRKKIPSVEQSWTHQLLHRWEKSEEMAS